MNLDNAGELDAGEEQAFRRYSKSPRSPIASARRPRRTATTNSIATPAESWAAKPCLFENVEGSDIPVAINTFGSYWRVNKALGTDNLEALAARVQQLVKPEIPTTLIEKMKKLPDLIKMGSFPPKTVRSGICQEVVLEGDRADLTRLPIIQCWPLDGNLDSGQVFDKEAAAKVTQRGTGRYITLGGIYTATPTPATAISACIACRSSARARPPCTGTCTMTVRVISACTRSAAKRCRWRSCWAANRSCPTPPPPRCRRGLKNCFSPAS